MSTRMECMMICHDTCHEKVVLISKSFMSSIIYRTSIFIFATEQRAF